MRWTTSRMQGAAWAIASLLLLAGCGQGYPRESVQARHSSTTFFGYLEDVVRGARSDVRRMDLADPCTLRVVWSDGVEHRYDLIDLPTAGPRRETPGRYALFLKRRAGGARRLLLASPHWGEFNMAVASISQLRGLCARELRRISSRRPPAA